MKEFKLLEDINLKVVQNYKNSYNDEWKLNYHFETPFGLINDPNGLSYYNGEYHLFFQWNPFGCEHKFKHWGLVKTRDFINYTIPKAVLAPTDWYDKNGCYSGSALVYNDKLELLYTGNVKDEEGNRESYQVRAICDENGNVIKVGPTLLNEERPEGYTAHFRDPKLFEKDGKYYFVIGVQNNELLGRALLYSSENFESWKFEGEIDTEYKNFGFMWECPSLFELGGKDVLLFSPQGLEMEEFKNQNIYQSGYVVGKLDYNTLKMKHSEFKEIDMGFDFYAPQVFNDDKGRTIMIGWMGMPEEESGHPTDKYNRMHCLTMARELTLDGDKLIQKPLEEYKNLREELLVDIEDAVGNQWGSHNINNNSYEFLLDLDKKDASELQLRFVVSDDELMIFKYDFDNNIAILDRTNMKSGNKGVRKLKLEKQENIKIHMFMDNSAVEIYLNDGKEVLSARIYPKDKGTGVQLLTKGNININTMKVWSLKGVRYDG